MISLRSFITIVCIGAGFANAYYGFGSIESEPIFAGMHFAISAGWVFIAARKMTKR